MTRSSHREPLAPATPHRRTSEWTLMLYLAGNNNLSAEMVWALKEIFRVGVPLGVSMTMQYDPVAGGSDTRFFRAPSREHVMNQDGRLASLSEATLGESDSGDPDALVRFIGRSLAEAPARYSMLVLAGHGAGVIGDFLTDTGARVGWPTALSLADLRQVFPRLRQVVRPEVLAQRPDRTLIDVIGMDSCLMNMAEVCSALKGEAGYLVGSEGFDPSTGWPYFRVLEGIADTTGRTALSPAALATSLVARHTAYYSDFADAGCSVDLAVCDLSRGAVETLEKAVAGFVDHYFCVQNTLDGWLDRLIVLAHWNAQSYKLEQYADIFDFCDLLAREARALAALTTDRNTPGIERLIERCEDVNRAVDRMVIASEFSGPGFQHSHGISIYFPWSRRFFADEYRHSAFAIATRWDRFLDVHLDATRRMPRRRDLGASSGDGSTVRPARADTLTAAHRFQMPVTRFQLPITRFQLPTSRFVAAGDDLSALLSSSMKNPATVTEALSPAIPHPRHGRTASTGRTPAATRRRR